MASRSKVTAYIAELQDAIRKLHRVKSAHIDSVRVIEKSRGNTVWKGAVEVFEIFGHRNSDRAYAWTETIEDPANSKRHITVLHAGAVNSPKAAVRTAIVEGLSDPQRFRIEP